MKTTTTRPARYACVLLRVHPTAHDLDEATIYLCEDGEEEGTFTRVSYEEGKRMMAHLMLCMGKMPEVRDHVLWTVYDIHGFYN